ncbi:MAG TPA: pyridoxal 5'-phosphate synthase glutaminase subunit PdxT [Candidatus Kapabacteria bacterium]|nr:pyridoxal 5'-phosphate synthase glutaminase subunit PdxT [Candidatus Kapabacteria bacterium]
MSPNIGILALQGDFYEHARMLDLLGYRSREIRRSKELNNIDALIIPGGESTTIAKLEDAATKFTFTDADEIPIFDAIKEKILSGMPVWGTCMGSIVLAKDIEGSSQGRIGLMDISVRRNAFGSQRQSLEILLNIPVLGQPGFPAVFIRAPLFTKSSNDVEILSEYDGGFVMAKQNNMLVTAFHPELTSDLRVHQYFLNTIHQ